MTPIANVSEHSSTLTNPRQKSISTTSFKIGSRPAWWTPTPRRSPSATLLHCGRSLSSRGSLRRARETKPETSARSAAEFKSKERSEAASASIFFLEKKKNAAGTRSRARSQAIRTRHCAASVRGPLLLNVPEAALELAVARAREPAAPPPRGCCCCCCWPRPPRPPEAAPAAAPPPLPPPPPPPPPPRPVGLAAFASFALLAGPSLPNPPPPPLESFHAAFAAPKPLELHPSASEQTTKACPLAAAAADAAVPGAAAAAATADGAGLESTEEEEEEERELEEEEGEGPKGNQSACSRGTGLLVVPVIQKQRPRVLPHHPANSSTLGTVCRESAREQKKRGKRKGKRM